MNKFKFNTEIKIKILIKNSKYIRKRKSYNLLKKLLNSL